MLKKKLSPLIKKITKLPKNIQPRQKERRVSQVQTANIWDKMKTVDRRDLQKHHQEERLA